MIIPTPIYIEDKISDVVDQLRLNGTILDIVDNGDGSYDVEVDNLTGLHAVFELDVYDWITISDTTGFSGQWKVTAINTTTLVISVTSPSFAAGITIPATFGTYKANKPYFSFEKWEAESNKLSANNLQEIYKWQKFPRIFLLEDIETTEGDPAYYNGCDLRIFLLCDTEQGKDAAWRLTNKYKTILQPLYDWFTKVLIESGYINNWNNRELVRTKTNRFFLGTQDENQNIINSRVDAIEVNYQNVHFMHEKNYCQT